MYNTKAKCQSLIVSNKQVYLASVMDDAEVGFILQFLGLEELGVIALLLEHLLHKALVCGFWKPALFIQQSKDTRGGGLHMEERKDVTAQQGKTYTTTQAPIRQ